MQTLIGLTLEAAKDILKKTNTDYNVVIISGGKDSGLLSDLHVVRAVMKESKLELIVTGFKTTM